MKKKSVVVFASMTAMSISIISGSVVNAADTSVLRENSHINKEMSVVLSDNMFMEKIPETNETRGIFTTKYIVSVNKATVRSGPGISYSSLGTLYKDDAIWVSSISNGWARFMINSVNHYISTNCIKKAAQ